MKITFGRALFFVILFNFITLIPAILFLNNSFLAHNPIPALPSFNDTFNITRNILANGSNNSTGIISTGWLLVGTLMIPVIGLGLFLSFWVAHYFSGTNTSSSQNNAFQWIAVIITIFFALSIFFIQIFLYILESLVWIVSFLGYAISYISTQLPPMIVFFIVFIQMLLIIIGAINSFSFLETSIGE